ncbi:hypothetical protein PHYSODRAFT_331926 [Phytophthora sojae]|uniref:Uncharacterized protein n=1 Tax=Phytophthora sojae (strain P6497) TaxID=1094619 RepID=G4ZHH6_PHYSP|nr:hypothetical protein PHYSODRAFT_331926 [Phytophthora sojae]EGZ18056.1 hypothetical protein PHYSODRAFT_331926 [Phytophthora sojae]|eukprot:XP_009527114.1 hypothetical protein PHYSODRAFT_331926 [Phytophthora sojae]
MGALLTSTPIPKTLQQFREKLGEEQARSRKLEGQLAAAENELTELRNFDLPDNDITIALRKELRNSILQLAEEKAISSGLRKKLAHVETELNLSKQSVATHADNLLKAQASHAKKLQNVHEDMNNLTREVDARKKKLEDRENEEEELQVKAEELQSHEAKLKEEGRRLQNAKILNEMKRQTRLLEEQFKNNGCQAVFKELEANLNRIEEERAAMQAERGGVRTQLESMKAALEAVKTENSGLQDTIARRELHLHTYKYSAVTKEAIEAFTEWNAEIRNGNTSTMQKKRDFNLGKMKEAFGSKTADAEEFKALAVEFWEKRNELVHDKAWTVIHSMDHGRYAYVCTEIMEALGLSAFSTPVMVRLTSRSFLHLTPEVVEFEAEHPFYAKVLLLDSEVVTFRSLEGGEGKLDRAVAEDHVDRASEVSQAGQISLLRRPVSVSLAGEVQYGQVISVDQSSVTIRSGGHEFVAAAAAVSVVPPVIVLLLEDVEFRSDEWSPTDLEAMEQSILSRLLGTGGSSASNQVSEILEGLMSEENHPSGDKDVEELFDPFPDDDDSPQDESERGAEVGRANTTTQHVTKRQQEVTVANGDDGHVLSKRQRVQTAIDQDALIIAKISDEPDLLERFVMIRKEANVKAQPAEGGGTMRTHVQKPSPTTRGKKSSKYAFAPSEEQELVHERITTEKHKAAEEGGALRAVQQRCMTDDRLLKDVMLIKVHRQVQDVRHEMMSGPARLEGHVEQGSQLRNGRNHDVMAVVPASMGISFPSSYPRS